jgi:chaperonin cofactor prefoldin
MKREFLKALGISDENIEQIMAEHGKDTEKFKNQITTLIAEKDNLTMQLSEANKKIESLLITREM